MAKSLKEIAAELRQFASGFSGPRAAKMHELATHIEANDGDADAQAKVDAGQAMHEAPALNTPSPETGTTPAPIADASAASTIGVVPGVEEHDQQ